MAAEFIVLGLLLALLLALILLGTGRERREKRFESRVPLSEIDEDAPAFKGSKCPLCGALLVPGERVHSHLYPGKPDGMMHIFGCPRCYENHPRPYAAAGRPVRTCPYCSQVLEKEDYLIARVFENPRKTQVHVLGCTVCRRGGPGQR